MHHSRDNDNAMCMFRKLKNGCRYIYTNYIGESTTTFTTGMYVWLECTEWWNPTQLYFHLIVQTVSLGSNDMLHTISFLRRMFHISSPSGPQVPVFYSDITPDGDSTTDDCFDCPHCYQMMN